MASSTICFALTNASRKGAVLAMLASAFHRLGVTCLFLGAVSSASAAIFDTPSLSGTTPSGLTWEYVSSGSALPLRSSGTLNGLPGAVAYWNTTNGELQLDPKGWPISLLIFTNTSSNLIPVSGTAAVSEPYGQTRTFPAGDWSPSVTASRLSGVINLIQSGSNGLATDYKPGNGAGSATTPYATNPIGMPCTPRYFNQPWSFGFVATSPMPVSDWFVIGVSGNLNANVLGYGNYKSTFQYTIDGVVGNQVGAIIPVAVPEPATNVLALTGAACGVCVMSWLTENGRHGRQSHHK
jgi:hypothetical protein